MLLPNIIILLPNIVILLPVTTNTDKTQDVDNYIGTTWPMRLPKKNFDRSESEELYSR